MQPPTYTITRIAEVSESDLRGLAEVLHDCVKGGASVSFMEPFPLEEALAFWRAVASDVRQGKRILLVAKDHLGICGTVQLLVNLPPNQPHRADVAKMLVHRRTRRMGIGAALMQAAEAEARKAGKTLLVLDTCTGSTADRLYTRLGWIRVGEIPDFALYPDGRPVGTTYFYRKLA